MTDPRFFSNPIDYVSTRLELRPVATPKRTRLGSEHVRWSLLDSNGDHVVALFCGIEDKLKGPVSVRYDRPYDAGDELYRLERDRIVAKGCHLRVLRMEEIWDRVGRRGDLYDRYGASDRAKLRAR